MNNIKGVLLCLVLTPFITQTVFAETTQVDKSALPLEEIKIFADIFAKIKKDYVEPVSDKQLLENAINGLLDGLDPHSAFLDAESYQALQEGTSGEFGGLGIEVGMEDGFVKVIAPIDNTPAKRAGVQAGDLIVRIEDKSVKGMSLNEAIKLMRGKPGTKIHLTIVRDLAEKPIELEIVREIIVITSVKGKILEDGFAYVRISSFQAHTADDLRKNIDALKVKNDDAPLDGLILDLRNNPGGTLKGAVGVSDLFLEQGLIVYAKGRAPQSQLEFNAKADDILERAPIVVLVNAGSASASEIVAGALQDHGRGLIVGEPSFGKGSVQTILPMPNQSALKLTTARYYTPNGHSIQASGINPDIVVKNIKVDTQQNQPSQQPLKEENLSGSLKRIDEDIDPDSSQHKDKAETDMPLIEKDYQLYEALNLLKALTLQKKSLLGKLNPEQ